jgi:Lon protease-like protein
VELLTIGVFPLPGLVLFPRTILPLHIFEPRYVKLIRDALGADSKIAVANLRKGWESDYFGAPALHRVVTIARLLDHEELPGERFNILLEGVQRAEVAEELAADGYRVIRVTPLVDLLGPEDRGAVSERRREMVALAERLASREPEMAKALTNLENIHRHPGIISDFLGSLLVSDAYERQSLLSERRVLRRMDLVCVELRRRLAGLHDPSLHSAEE